MDWEGLKCSLIEGRSDLCVLLSRWLPELSVHLYTLAVRGTSTQITCCVCFCFCVGLGPQYQTPSDPVVTSREHGQWISVVQVLRATWRHGERIRRYRFVGNPFGRGWSVELRSVNLRPNGILIPLCHKDEGSWSPQLGTKREEWQRC